jgi:SOS response regulatory protein OraA/RecX
MRVLKRVTEHARIDDRRYARSQMDASSSMMPTYSTEEQLPSQRVVQGVKETEQGAGAVMKKA